jgi:putative ABC transport system permease protein
LHNNKALLSSTVINARWYWHNIMIKTLFKNALRSLARQKGYTFINIAGLAIGVASCILLTLYIIDESSFDSDFSDAERIYKLVLERKEPEKTSVIGGVPHSYATVLANDCPEIERVTTITGPFNDMMITYQDSKNVKLKFLEKDVYAADSNFFKIFSFKILKGNRETMLQQPKSMVLTQSAASRHFGESDPIGKVIRMSGSDFVVTGVCADAPANTHFNFNLIISIQTIERFNLQNFNRPDTYCYLKLKAGSSPLSLEPTLRKMVSLYAAPDFEKVNQTSWNDYLKAGNDFRYFLCPLADIYLFPENVGGFKPAGNILVIRVLFGIDILILVIACINFINLTTARATDRAKEVGIRKVIGSSRINLIFGFLTESFVVACLGVAAGVLIVVYSLPLFNEISSKDFSLEPDSNFVTALFGLVCFITLLAGIYPAMALSSFKPASVLRGNNSTGHSGRWFRNGLVIFQFCMSILLIIGTLVIYQQVKFISEKNLGYNKQHLLIVEGDFHMKPVFTKTFIEKVRKLSQVVSAAGSLSMPSEGGIYPQQYRCESMQAIQSIPTMYIGDHYAEVMGFEKTLGNLFSENTNDSLSVIVNETAVRTLGLTDPIGKQITYVEQTYGSGETTIFTIAGVIKDFNFKSLHENIEPLIIQSNEIIFSRMAYAVVRLQPGSSADALESIQSIWQRMDPEAPLQFKFMDNVLNDLYHRERHTGKIIALFSVLSIIVASIGLFGLSAYTASARSKEIGIRKVVGARSFDILILLSKDFSKVVVIAFAIAAPLGWYAMEQWWLSLFAFRIQITIWTLLPAGACALLVAWLTVGFHALKAAIRTPIKYILNS